MNFELLLAEPCEGYYNIVGIGYSNALVPNSNIVRLRASISTIELVKRLLKDGKCISVGRDSQFSEIQPYEIVVSTSGTDKLSVLKQTSLNDIQAKMNQAIFAVSVLDAMEYMSNYMKLLNNGVFITDANREEKYFDIISNAQSVEMPDPLPDDATFEQQQDYSQKKKAYDIAQDSLSTLEKYLNAYDSLFRIKYVNDVLQKAKSDIKNANTEADVKKAIDEYTKVVDGFSTQQ